MKELNLYLEKGDMTLPTGEVRKCLEERSITLPEQTHHHWVVLLFQNSILQDGIAFEWSKEEIFNRNLQVEFL